MDAQKIIKLFTLEPVNFGLKGKLLAVALCFCAIATTAWVCKLSMGSEDYPLLVASMGASSTILFIVPNSPFAQPWQFVGGQMFSALAGISSAQMIPDTFQAASVAVGLSVLLMLLFRCLHPPGAATALAPVLGGPGVISLGYGYALIPVGVNVLAMLAMAVIINRWVMKYDYPALPKTGPTQAASGSSPNDGRQAIGVSEHDMLQALEKSDVFVDMTVVELAKILTSAELHRFKRLSKHITCAEIMDKNVVTVEYGTEVEEAWQLMVGHNLKAVPVIDRARRIVGIVTWHDFFKFVDLGVYGQLSRRLRTFIRRTPDITAAKPEAVGQIMASPVASCAEGSHIVELIPLMVASGHRQVPIVNSELRLVGMVYQKDLIAALYNQHLAVGRV